MYGNLLMYSGKIRNRISTSGGGFFFFITILILEAYIFIGPVVFGQTASSSKPLDNSNPVTACLIDIDDDFSGQTLQDVRKQTDMAVEKGMRAIIFRFSGQGSSYRYFSELGRDIAYLKKKNVQSIAYIPKESMGMTLLAVFACEDIFVGEFAQLGRVGPLPKAAKAQPVDEQIVANKLVSFANASGHDPLLARAMVQKKIVLYKVQKGGTTKIVDQAGYEKLVLAENAQWTLVGDGPLVGEDEVLLLSGRQAYELDLAAGLVGDLGELEKKLSLKLADSRSSESKADDKGRAVEPEVASDEMIPTGLSVTDGKTAKAVVIQCSEMIDEGLFESIKRRVQAALAEGATIIIFEIDTFGGRLDSAISIWNYIMYDISETAHTVAYIPTKAVSAGALISVACDDIIMKESTLIGDCAPIAMGSKLEGIEREKVESPTRTYFETAAKANNYPVAICRAMVTMGIEVYQVRNLKTGEFEYFEGGDLPSDFDTYDLDAKQLIDAKDELVTIDAGKAFEYGLSRAVVKNLDEALAFLERRDDITISRPVEVITTNWSEELVRWLASPAVAGILLTIAMIGIYVELNSPGVGLPGAVALIALALLFGSKYFIGLANWWEIALFFVGFALLAVEIFVIPGFGVAGISGILLILFALVAMMVANQPNKLPIPVSQMDWELFWDNMTYMSVGLILFFVISSILSRYLDKLPVASKLVLSASGSSAAAPSQTIGEPESSVVRVGLTGMTLSQLRPSGYARISNQRIDVVSRGEVIEKDRPVRVLEVEGNRVIVKEIEIVS